MKRWLLMGSVLMVFVFAFAPATNWNADAAKAQIKFSITGPFGLVNGTLSGLKSTIVFDENNLAVSSVVASVAVNTIETGIGKRDKDLQKEEWLNVEKYPRISFSSNKIEKTATGYKVTGDLTLKGVTKPVEIPFSFEQSGNTGVMKGSFSINREDYSVGKSPSIEKTVAIVIEVPVSK